MRPSLKLASSEKPRFVSIESGLVLNTESGVFYVRKTFRRYRIPDLFESTRETKIQKARARRDQLVADHLAKYLKGDQSGLSRKSGRTVASIIDEVLETVTPGTRKRTQENHRFYLGELRKEWGRWDISRIDLSAWSIWIKDFRTRKSRKTFFDYQKNMNLVLHYAYDQRYVSHRVELPNPDTHKPAWRLYTDAEISALWRVMNEETRDEFSLCFECFMRLREALYLTWDRVDLKTGVVTLRPEDVKTGSKTGKGRAFIVSALALARLRARRKRIEGPWVFPRPDGKAPVHSNKTAWRQAKKLAGITGKARWHDLRHSALSKALLDSGADIVRVSEYSGVSIKTLQRVYLHSTPQKTEAVSRAVRIIRKKV